MKYQINLQQIYNGSNQEQLKLKNFSTVLVQMQLKIKVWKNNLFG